MADGVSGQSQPITRERIERALNVLAQWMMRLGPDGVKCLPIYERLERELETLSSTESKMAEIVARAKNARAVYLARVNLFRLA
ncbi:hypothetical protein ACWGNA_19785 [Brucella cytisi]|uniref:hypothetical protein n=1 Tax=Brucella cytisi TaxID=407152 RepID=UPI0035DD9CBD